MANLIDRSSTEKGGLLGILACALLIAASLTPLEARAHDVAGEEDAPIRSSSLVGMAPLAAGETGMILGGGAAVAMPYATLEASWGVGGDVDLGFHYETIIGLVHIPQLVVRWAPLHLGDWDLGIRFGLNYLVFGLQGDNLNLTSTLYLTPELAASVHVSRATLLVFSVLAELDVLVLRVIDDETQPEGTFRYDATALRVGVQTTMTDDLDFFAQLRMRIPTETFVFEDTPLFVIPFIDVGVTWSW